MLFRIIIVTHLPPPPHLEKTFCSITFFSRFSVDPFPADMFLITILPRNICIILDVIKTLSIPLWHCCTAPTVVQEMATLSERDVTVPSSFKAHPLCKYLEEITQILRNLPTSRWNIQSIKFKFNWIQHLHIILSALHATLQAWVTWRIMEKNLKRWKQTNSKFIPEATFENQTQDTKGCKCSWLFAIPDHCSNLPDLLEE